jgi:tetratricopeptide (TPR) repeat protein
LESIALLKAERAYFQQINQFISLAVYANKFKEFSDRDYYLVEAKRIIDINNFPNEHYSNIYFQQGYYAELAGDYIEAEKYYRWVIELFKPEQEWWSKERAQYHLSSILIRNNRTSDAVDLFKNEGPLTAKEKIILAGIYQTWQKPQEAITLAKQAYSETVLSGELWTSLDAALILIELSAIDTNLATENYIHYLKKDAMPYWLMLAKPRLQKLGLHPL